MYLDRKATKWIPWVLILPALLTRGFTTIFPIFETVKNSFYDIKTFQGSSDFVGFSNYKEVFSDPKIITSLQFTAIFVAISMFFHIIFGIGLAMILNIKFAGKRFLRTIVLIPWAMPAVVVGMAAKWAFNNDYGLINDLIRRFVGSFDFNWLINTGSVRAAVIAVDLWKDVPFFAILVLSSLQFISNEVYEAALVDGANSVQTFFRITLPLISKTVVTLTIPFTLWRLTTFDIVYAMTSGGPGEDTALIAYRIATESFTNLNIGYASTLAVYLFLVMAVFSFLNMKYVNKIVD